MELTGRLRRPQLIGNALASTASMGDSTPIIRTVSSAVALVMGVVAIAETAAGQGVHGFRRFLLCLAVWIPLVPVSITALALERRLYVTFDADGMVFFLWLASPLLFVVGVVMTIFALKVQSRRTAASILLLNGILGGFNAWLFTLMNFH